MRSDGEPRSRSSDGTVLTTPEGAGALDLRVHDLEHRLAALDRDGIEVAVVSLQTTLGLESLEPAAREELELAWVEGIQRGRSRVRRPDPRVRPREGDRRLRRNVDRRLGAARARGERIAPAAVDAAGGLLFVHPEAAGPIPPGRPPWWGWTIGYAGQMQRAYFAWLADGRERLPVARVVFTILAGGAPFLLERLTHRGVEVRSALDPGVFFDTATHGRRAIELCIETFGAGQLVYGSDMPVVDSHSTLQAVRGFGDAVARLLQIETPGALLR